MNRVLISAISLLRKNAVPQPYNDNTFDAMLSNEACAKYLLRNGPRPDVIIALCTTESLEEIEVNDYSITSYGYYKGAVKEYCRTNQIPIPKIRMIRISRREQTSNHYGQTLKQIMEILWEYGKDSQILIDTTGGLRNISIMTQSMARLLGYYGFPDIKAYYVNYMEKRVFNDHTDKQLEIMEAIAQFANHGTVKQLAKYFQDSKYEEIKELLAAMQEFSDSIQICKTEHLPDIINKRIFPALDHVSEIKDARANREDISALQQMVVYIKSQFGWNGIDNQITPLTLIEWCLNNGYIQQAVTMFTENIPKYLVDAGLLTVNNPQKYRPPLLHTANEMHWLYTVLIDSCSTQMNMGEVIKKLDGIKHFSLQTVRRNLPDFSLKLTVEQEAAFKGFLYYYVYIKRAIRNILNHASENEKPLTNPQRAEFRMYGVNIDDLTPSNISQNLTDALNLLKQCIPNTFGG